MAPFGIGAGKHDKKRNSHFTLKEQRTLYNMESDTGIHLFYTRHVEADVCRVKATLLSWYRLKTLSHKCVI